MNELMTDLIEVLQSDERRSLWRRLFRSRQARLSSSFEIGDVYRTRRTETPFRRVPRVIYFYYLKFADDGSLVAEEYRYFNKVDPLTPDPLPNQNDDPRKYQPIQYGNELKDKIAILVKNARGPKNDPPPLPVGDFQDLDWKRRCYFVVFFDEEKWKLFGRTARRKSPIIFLTRKNYNGKLSRANHTFYDADFLELDLEDEQGNPQKRACFFLMNHMKDDESGQTDLGHGSETKQYFSFNILMEVYFAGQTNATLLVIFDPGGTNQGPPLEP